MSQNIVIVPAAAYRISIAAFNDNSLASCTISVLLGTVGLIDTKRTTNVYSTFTGTVSFSSVSAVNRVLSVQGRCVIVGEGEEALSAAYGLYVDDFTMTQFSV